MVSSMVGPPRFSSSRESLVVPGIGTIHVLREQPCKSDLRRRGFLLLREVGDNLDEGLIGLAIFFAEAWDNVAEVGTVELSECVDLAGKEAFDERTQDSIW
jgi:hypothetical protein